MSDTERCPGSKKDSKRITTSEICPDCGARVAVTNRLTLYVHKRSRK